MMPGWLVKERLGLGFLDGIIIYIFNFIHYNMVGKLVIGHATGSYWLEVPTICKAYFLGLNFREYRPKI